MSDDLTMRIQGASLTYRQRIIAEYVLKNKSRISSMTSLALAKEIGVSDASVIRFARAIGYDGYSDMKLDFHLHMEEDMAESDVGQYPTDKRLSIQTEKFAGLDLRRELPRLMEKNLERSILQNQPESYERAVAALHNGRRKYVLGLRGGRAAAEYFGRLLGFLLDDVRIIHFSEGDIVADIQNLRKGDVVVVISYARYLRSDEGIAKLVKARGATLCALVDSKRSPFTRYADIVLNVETQHVGFSTSIVGTIAVLELILTMLSRQHPQVSTEHLAEREKFLSTFHLEE